MTRKRGWLRKWEQQDCFADWNESDAEYAITEEECDAHEAFIDSFPNVEPTALYDFVLREFPEISNPQGLTESEKWNRWQQEIAEEKSIRIDPASGHFGAF